MTNTQGDTYGNQQLTGGGQTGHDTGSGVYAIFRTTDFASYSEENETSYSSTEQDYYYDKPFLNAGE